MCHIRRWSCKQIGTDSEESGFQNTATMSESSRKTHSPLTCLVFAMLVAYAGCATTVNSSLTTTQAGTAPPASVSSSISASLSPASSTPSNSSETSASTSPGSSPTPSSGNGSTDTPATSPTTTPGTVTTGQSGVKDSSVSTTTAAPQSSPSPGSTTPETTTPNNNGTTEAPKTTALATGTPPTAAPTTEGPTTAAPTTEAPTTAAPTTEAPTTAAPTSPESTTTAPTTPAPTTPAPTTAPPPPNSKPIKPDATFLLTIDVGPGKDVSCNGCNYSSVKNYFKTEFEKIPGYFSIASAESTTVFNVNIRFSGTEIQTLNETLRQQEIWDALVRLNNTVGAGLLVMESAKTIASAFAEKLSSSCNMDGACDVEYDCTNGYCLHKCEDRPCGDHGTCSVTINSGKASTACVCNSDDETTYSGEKCEKSEISQKKVAAIVGGVLGAFCGLFIIIIIIMCCRQRSNSSSSSKYQLGGNTNPGYSSMGMKEL